MRGKGCYENYLFQSYNPQYIFQYFCSAVSVPEGKDIVDISKYKLIFPCYYAISTLPSIVTLHQELGSGDRGQVKQKEMKAVEKFKYTLLLHLPLLFWSAFHML